ncbi:M18 family aminopeptidase [Ilumatobacter nonamiensis]|uniref:M18 family aminopeptidase n=1 Tax=Ilumatobacter nonamiensis TaxID=467093 RepID=UPI0003458381|nr:M18 family aminopeptidase [Ilumatobacter nonamiensis]
MTADHPPTDDSVLDDLRGYLDRSPSPWHAVTSTLERLDGFAVLDEQQPWDDIPARGCVVRDGALIAWSIPDSATPSTGFRLAGAHTDSPCLRVKPRPDAGLSGWKQLGVEVYGGILNNTWLDRDLGVAGRIVTNGGEHVDFVSDGPIARVPQLAVHLDRGVNDQGLVLDRQMHLTPVWGIGPAQAGEFAEWLADAAGVDDGIAWWDLCLHDVQPSAVLGVDASMLTSARLDNQLSCWAATRALSSAEPDEHIALIVLNDHEEVGSSSTTGAQGPFLETVLERLVESRGGSRSDLHRARAASACISADNAHAVHPNYLDRHEPEHSPIINSGPAIKVNSNQRYATSATTAALFQNACETAGVPWQVFVSRNNMPCGSTIGPITATRLGIETVDVGVPQLSMHSARELCGTEDPLHLAAALGVFFG